MTVAPPNSCHAATTPAAPGVCPRPPIAGSRPSASLCGWLLALLLVADVASVQGQYLRIRDICRIKGHEENTLHGMGIVVGLQGTGDTDPATRRALARIMELMGKPVGQSGADLNEELKDVKSAALVYVTAQVPPEGARQGEQVPCSVNVAGSAKSLQGGRLLLTPLVGPVPGQTQVYAIAQGSVTLAPSGPPTSAVIHGGCRLEYDFSYPFTNSQDQVTLVIDRNHAGFPTAYAIQNAINEGEQQGSASAGLGRASWGAIARAIDPVNIEVKIPAEYQDDRVGFVAHLLDTLVGVQPNDARVVVNERNGVIVVSEKVMVGRVLVTHKNISIQTGNDPVNGPLLLVDPDSQDTSTTRLKAMMDALNALKVSPQDIIDIIKSLERSGDLYGRLIIE